MATTDLHRATREPGRASRPGLPMTLLHESLAPCPTSAGPRPGALRVAPGPAQPDTFPSSGRLTKHPGHIPGAHFSRELAGPARPNGPALARSLPCSYPGHQPH